MKIRLFQQPARAPLIQAWNGRLYGTTDWSVFEISDLAGAPAENVIHNFTGGNDGGGDVAALVQASNGKLYGSTYQGGGSCGFPSGCGTIFQIDNLGGTPTESVIYSFSGGNDGADPNAPLVQASDGDLYGTAALGGSAGHGTVFRVGNLSGVPDFTVLHTFTGGSDGSWPNAALIQASDGNLYGTAVSGGSTACAYGCGTVFRITNLGGVPTFTVVHAFMGGSDGAKPFTALVEASDGNLYGTTSAGGGSSNCYLGCGTIFRISNPGGTPTTSIIYSFSGGNDGEAPSGLIQALDGDLYGTTENGGAGYAGSVFRITGLCPVGGPMITAPQCVPPNAAGLTASVPPVPGGTYHWTITGGTIDSGQGTDAISFTSGPAGTPVTLQITETAQDGCVTTTLTGSQVDFNDVTPSSPFYSFIYKVAHDGLAAGCGGGNFCPGSDVIRSQMAVFLLRGEHGSTYVPPAADCGTYPFSDVTCPSPFANWIEQVYNEGITGGCSTNPLNYCPSNPVSRAGMAVFLLVAEHGTGYVPPACVGLFTDVACPSPFANWIEELYAEGITGGCATNPLAYCPGDPVTRAQMAVFLTVTFTLP